jgi:4-amino-4-deoxy-L-arabinose transferase-like glycosyltransferase
VRVPASSTLRSLLAVLAAVLAIGTLLAVRNAVVTAPLERLARSERDGQVVYEGSWHFPRGGPYILGYEAPAAARLTIDGQVVARGAGQQSARRVYEPGVYAVRFEVPAGASGPGSEVRLLWHPPGRRGPLEYVPASSLASGPPGGAPAQAEFGRWAGAAPVDGLVSGLCALILVALSSYLARGVIAAADRGALRWAALVAALALAVRLWELGAAGQTWDEDVNWSAGKNYVTNLLSLDFAAASWTWNYEHPPVMKYIAGIGAQWADGYGPARALSALLVALGCALLVPIGRRLFSLRAGALAGVLAALSPHLIAHGKIVGHEAPTVLWWALGVWLALRAYDPPSGPPGPRPFAAGAARDPLPGRLAVIGLVVGLAVFSRFANALLGPLVGLILLITAPAGKRWRTLGLGLGIVVPVAVLVGFAVWPRLWDAPIANLQESWAKLRVPHAAEPFLGVITNQPSRAYFAVYLLATAPVGLLAGVALWVARALRRGRAELRSTAVVLLWLLVPMAVAFSPVRQDGVRYIMPCLLALAVVAAAGVDAGATWLGARLQARRPGVDASGRVFAALAAVLVAYLGIAAGRIHPYYLDYYGEHVGGPAGVAERKLFEVAWWGEGIADAVDHLNRHAAPGARVHRRCVEPSHLTWLRADLWPREAQRVEQADWILVYAPAWRDCPLPPGAVLAHEVSAQGAPLVRVYRVERK